MGQRGIAKSVAMGVIPFVNLYLFYCLCKEAKVKWQEAALNPTLLTLLAAFPVLQAFAVYSFAKTIERNLAREGRKAYVLPALPLALAFIAPFLLFPFWVFIFPALISLALYCGLWAYFAYATQSRFNENGVESLG